MRLTANDIHGYYKPSLCPLRIYFGQKNIQKSPSSPYEQILERLGQEHEKRHLATFGNVVNLSGGSIDERAKATIEEISRRSPVIYQGVLLRKILVAGLECELVGRPDFIIRQSDCGYTIRDSKMSRRITEKDHPEILLQLELYGLLFEMTFNCPPVSLEVHSGAANIVKLDYRVGQAIMPVLEEIVKLKMAGDLPYSPVGWSKCTGCGYFDHCWSSAENRGDVALVQGVDQGLATALHAASIDSYTGLLSAFDTDKLTEFKRPFGKTMRKVGIGAASILRNAQALASGKEILIQPPIIKESKNYVMFDLEGLPPQLDEIEKIYLWGMQVFGVKPGLFRPAVAGFGSEGDLVGWENFLKHASLIFNEYGDIPFVHWHHYEKTHIDMYIERFGDRDSVAARVKQNLLDLLPIVKDSIALPLPSNSLKIVEQYVGFKRKLVGYHGDTAIARFIEATETTDTVQRDNVMREILQYNAEDLEAMWTVLQWLRSKCSNR